MQMKLRLGKAVTVAAALLSATPSFAHDMHYITNSGRLTMIYRCLHIATTAGNPDDAEALLRIGDYEGLKRGLSPAHLGEVKGYARRWSEEDIKTHGSPTAAYNALGCSTVAKSPIVGESPNQRIPPPR